MPGPPGTAKNWAAYRARFIEPKRLAAGVQWWQAHAQTLADAQERYGVPPEIVAGVLGVETFYGRMTGNYRVLDALATLAFDFPSGPLGPQRVLPQRAARLPRVVRARGPRGRQRARLVRRRDRLAAVHAQQPR